VSIHVSYSRTEMKKAIQGQVKIDPSNSTRILTQAVLTLFRDRYTSGAVRRIGVFYSGFVDEHFSLISLFDQVEMIEKE
ncbi:DinB/UmuC family translesion DNA polymerase, partial [Streptococcus pyogenes]